MFFGVFLDPSPYLKKNINFWKKKIMLNYGKCKFVMHPAHCTLFYSKIFNRKFAIKKLDLLARRIGKIKLTINKKSTFIDYSSSKGKLVLYFNVKYNKKLYKLQNEILNILSKYVDKKYIFKNIYLYKKNKISKDNFSKFGFPFVNKNWTPHFTIASIKNDQHRKKFISNFLNAKIKHVFYVKSLSYWNINANKHDLIKRIIL
jgi:2'-5' RNA ligase